MSPARRQDRPGEFEVIARYFAPLAAGEGAFGLLDDAAFIRPRPGEDLVITKDTLAAGIHFFAADPPDAIARKALRVNLSDLVAKGARPHSYLLSLALAEDWSEDWLRGFAEGLAEDQRAYDVVLLGGDTLKSPDGVVISITAVGTLESGTMVTRLGGGSGDLLYVSGTIGDGALGLMVHGGAPGAAAWPLSDADRSWLARRYLLPEPRTALAETVRRHAGAAMDISDGLLGDLEKMCRACRLGAVVHIERIPHSDPVRAVVSRDRGMLPAVLNGGDDYELLCAVRPEAAGAFERSAAAAGVPVSRIGELTKYARGVSVVDDGGETVPIPTGSFEHF